MPKLSEQAAGVMLTPAMCQSYNNAVASRTAVVGVELVTTGLSGRFRLIINTCTDTSSQGWSFDLQSNAYGCRGVCIDEPWRTIPRFD